MSNIYSGGAMAQGVEDIDENRVRRAQARELQYKSSEALRQHKQEAPIRDMEVDQKFLEQQVKLEQTQAAVVKQKSYDAFSRYEKDKDVKHLNNTLAELKKDEYGANLYGDYTRLDKIQQDSEVLRQQVSSAGFDPDEFMSYNEDFGNFLMATKADGSQEVLDMDAFYDVTGYTDHRSQQEVAKMIRNREIQAQLRMGAPYKDLTEMERMVDRVTMDLGISQTQAYKFLQDVKNGSGAKSGRHTELFQIMDLIKQDNPNISDMEALDMALNRRYGNKEGTEARNNALARMDAEGIPRNDHATFKKYYQQELTQSYQTNRRSQDQVKFEEVETAKNAIDKEFKGDFFGADWSTIKANPVVQRQMARIEQEFPLKNEDRRTLVYASQLAQLGSTASDIEAGLTPQESGLIDSLMYTGKKYLMDQAPENAQAVAAYEGFRNVMRHALFGATQSAAESTNFEKAMGNLKMGHGQVLSALKTQVQDIQAQLQAVVDLNDPYVAYYRTGMTQDKLVQVVDQLNVRLDYLNTANRRYVNKGQEVKTGKDGKPIKVTGKNDTPPPSVEDMASEF